MRQRKYIYWRVLQQNWGSGWEDVNFHDLHDSTVKERKQAFKDYKENQPEIPLRWITRKELKK